MTTIGTDSKRPRYFDRQQLRADDLTLEQSYQDTRIQQLNRHLHGWGVVCGAIVEAVDGLSVTLQEGFAISPSGKAIHIPAVESLNLDSLLTEACGKVENDCEDAITGSTEANHATTQYPLKVYLIAVPVDKPGTPLSAFPEDCDYHGNTLENSRICDSVCLRLVCELPPLHQSPETNCDLLSRFFCAEPGSGMTGSVLNELFPCPPALAEEDDYVVLASLTLNILENQSFPSIISVNYSDRRILVPVQLLQSYMACLCAIQTNPQTDTPTYNQTLTPSYTPTFSQTFTPPGGLFTEPFTQPGGVFTEPFTPPGGVITEPFTPPGGVITEPFTPPGGVFTQPGGGFTQPGGGLIDPVAPLVVEGIDILNYDTVSGKNTNIDEMTSLSDANKGILHEHGINNLLELYTADTGQLAESLGISEIQVAEYKDNALESMRRAETITLSGDTYDIIKGMSLAVEKVNKVGRKRGQALASAGFASVADVANSNSAALTKVLNVSDETAQDLIRNAQTRMMK